MRKNKVSKLKVVSNIVRLLILVLLVTGYNKNIIDYIKKQNFIKREGIYLMIDGVKYRVMQCIK